MIRLPTDVLQPGMILGKAIVDEKGQILLRRGVPLTQDYIITLKRRRFSSVFIMDDETLDIDIEDIISDEVQRNAHRTLGRLFDFVRDISNDFDRANSDAVVASMQDSGIVRAVRGHEGFKHVEDSVTAIMGELVAADTLTSIGQLRSHDDVTFNHSINVTVTALLIGKQLHLNQQDLKRLGVGCMLHDIGKVFIHPDLLHNSSPSPEVTRQLREHPRLGYELLRTRNPDAVMTNHVALEHHERQDGFGYPRGLQGTNTVSRPSRGRQNILLIAEIVTVADVYDLLSVSRPGRPALPPQQIANTMRRLAGTFLNQAIVEHFLLMLPIFPVGIGIIVRSGRYANYRGIVIKMNKDEPERPVIRLLTNPRGDRITPIELDLKHEQTMTVEAQLH